MSRAIAAIKLEKGVVKEEQQKKEVARIQLVQAKSDNWSANVCRLCNFPGGVAERTVFK